MGVPSALFVDTYSEKVTTLMIKLVEYMQAMDKIINPSAGPTVSTSLDTGPINVGPIDILTTIVILKPTALERNKMDIPLYLILFPHKDGKKTTWDKLFTDYLGQQYCLACGEKKIIFHTNLSLKSNKTSLKTSTFLEKQYSDVHEMSL